jgi:tRNA A-37 threonylcarbamoyl transferase component Bud32
MVVDGQRTWRKRYAGNRRRWALALLAVIARTLHLPPLRPPPRQGPGQARALEERRLRMLQAQSVRVPEILDAGPDWLALEDIGPTLAARLHAVIGDARATDVLTRTAIAAITAAHRRGAYFGQPLPRNLALDDRGVGFLDFEEDPLDVMTLAQAQARDWLLFTYGIARYYDDRPQALAALLDEALEAAPASVAGSVRAVGGRLQPLARLARGCGRAARSFAHAVAALRG